MPDSDDFRPAVPPAVPVVRARPILTESLDYAPSPAKPPNPLALASLTRRLAGLDLLLVLLITLGAPITIALVARALSPEAESLHVDWLTVAAKWADAAIACGLATYFVLVHRTPAASMGLRREYPAAQAGWALAALGLCYVCLSLSVFIVLGVSQFYPTVEQDVMERVDFVEAMPLRDLRMTLLLLVPVAIHEEVLFRGLILTRLWRLSGRPWVAVVVSAVIFGALHISQGLIGVLQVTGLGLIFGMCYVRSRSLPAMIVAHFLFDFCQFQLLRLLQPMIPPGAG